MKKLLTFFAMVVALLVSSASVRGETAPDVLYIVGDITGNSWDTTKPIASSLKEGNKHVFQNVSFTKTSGEDQWQNQFTFITKVGSGDNPWDVVNKGDRYGANVSKGANEWMDTGDNKTKTLKKFPINGTGDDNASSATNFRVQGGSNITRDIVVDFDNMQVTLMDGGSYTPAEATVELCNMNNASQLTLTKSDASWIGEFDFPDNNGSDNTARNLANYYFKLTCSNGDVKYGHIYSNSGDWYTKIDNNKTYTSTSSPALHNSASATVNSHVSGFNLEAAKTNITVTLNAAGTEIASVAFSTGSTPTPGPVEPAETIRVYFSATNGSTKASLNWSNAYVWYKTSDSSNSEPGGSWNNGNPALEKIGTDLFYFDFPANTIQFVFKASNDNGCAQSKDWKFENGTSISSIAGHVLAGASGNTNSSDKDAGLFKVYSNGTWHEMTVSADGKTFTYDVPDNKQFRIGADNNRVLFGTSVSLIPGGTQTVSVGGTGYVTWNNYQDGVTLTFDPGAKTISASEGETPIPAAGFTLNATTAPKVIGWLGVNIGGGWDGTGEAFTLVSSDPVTYTYEFTAGDNNYIAVSDSNSKWYHTTDNDKTLIPGGVATTFVEGKRTGSKDNGQQIHLDNLTVGETYVLRLTQTASGPALSIDEPYQLHEAPAVTVKTVDGKGVFTISATLTSGEKLYYSVNGGETKEIANRGTVTVDATSTLTAWVVDANNIKGNEKSLKWTNPADVTNPVTAVELFDNSSGGSGASKASFTKSGTSNWGVNFAFLSADSKSWNNYYFLKLTYKDNSVRYCFLGGTGLNNIDQGVTYTTSTSPALSTSATKINGNNTCAGFGLRGGDGSAKYQLTIELDATQQNVVSLKVAEPVIANALPTIDWTLSDVKWWTDAAGNVATDKYFYISWNQNDNRVSPEWELEKQSDGTFLIDNFMVIPNGQFRIRNIHRDPSTGNLTKTDWGWQDNANYTIGISNVGISADDRVLTGKHYGSPVTMKNGKRGFRWDVGFTIGSVKFNPTTHEITYGIDLDQPSTLKQASKPGLPFVAMMGNNVKVPIAEGQSINYALDLGADPNHAYTNAWVQYDADGKLYRYGNLGSYASLYKVNNDGDVNSSGTPARGQVMNSTRVPPVNLIPFAQDVNGERSEFTSRDVTFEYTGVVSDIDKDASGNDYTINGVKVRKSTELTATTADGHLNGIPGTNSGTRYAAYTIESVTLEGLFKIFNGYGGHTYGSAVNGLSFFANWGVGQMPSNDVYANEAAQDGSFVPLAGGGTKVDDNGSTNRGADGGDTAGPNDTYEDNDAGKYVNFTERSYVWKATFYYALEDDGYTGSDHHQIGANTGSYLNTGRDYSWIHFNFSNAPATLELQLQGSDRGKPVWSINAANDQEAVIHNYTVKVYPVDRNGNYVTDPSAAPENIEEDDRAEWPSASTTSYALQRGSIGLNADADVSYVAEGTSSVTVNKLPAGRYIAVMTYELTQNGLRTTRVLTSNIIQIINVDVDPVITATQRKIDKAYTFDVVARANVNAIYKEYVTKAQNAGQTIVTPDHFEAFMTVPYVAKQGPVYLETADGDWTQVPADRFTVNDDGTATIDFPAGTFGADASATQLYFPRVRVLDYIPEDVCDFTITVKPNADFSINDAKTATATVQIDSPKASYYGTPTLKGDEKAGYNYVTIANGGFTMVDGESLYDGQTGNDTDERFNTAARFTTAKLLTIVTADGYVDLSDTPIAVDNADIDRLPYVTANGAPVAQTYDVETRTYYIREADGANNFENPSEAELTTLTLDAVELAAPRSGMSDKAPKHKAEFRKRGIADSEYRTVAGVEEASRYGESTANDFVTIVDEYTEVYGGANSNVEDAYIAAELTEPTRGLVVNMPLSEQTIRHHATSMFHPSNHLKGDEETGTPHEMAPGVLHVKSAADINDGTNKVWWASSTNPAHNEHAEHFEARYYRDFDGNVNPFNQPSAQADGAEVANLPKKPDAFWAGCPQAVLDKYADRYIDYADGKFDRLDPQAGLYGTRNHHVRQGWLGGDPISFTFFRYMFVNKFDADGNIASLNVAGADRSDDPVFGGDVSKAMAYREMMTELIKSGTGTKTTDAELSVDENEFTRRAWLNEDRHMQKPYALLRVCHVNHESWWASPLGQDVTQQWFGASGLSRKDFLTVVSEMIKYPSEYYTPVVYDLSYTYPFLNNYSHVDVVVADAEANLQQLRLNKVRTAPVALAEGETTPVKARSTGLISFDSTAAAPHDIATGIDNVEADSDTANGGISIRYDRATGIATVTASADVKAVNVYDMSGKQFGVAVTLRGTAATADLGQLGAGVYTVRAVTSGASMTVKVQK